VFKKMKSKLISTKDSTISFAIEQIINAKLKSKDTKVEKFFINTQEKIIEGNILLPKSDSIYIKAIDYKITVKNGKYFLEVEKLHKSKEFNNSYLDGKRYKIPQEILKIVEFIL